MDKAEQDEVDRVHDVPSCIFRILTIKQRKTGLHV